MDDPQSLATFIKDAEREVASLGVLCRYHSALKKLQDALKQNVEARGNIQIPQISDEDIDELYNAYYYAHADVDLFNEKWEDINK